MKNSTSWGFLIPTGLCAMSRPGEPFIVTLQAINKGKLKCGQDSVRI